MAKIERYKDETDEDWNQRLEEARTIVRGWLCGYCNYAERCKNDE